MSLDKARTLLANNAGWYDVDDDLEELFGKKAQIGEALWTLFRDGSWGPTEGFLDALETAKGAYTADDVAKLIAHLAGQPNAGGLSHGWDSDLTRMLDATEVGPSAAIWPTISEPVRTPMGFRLAVMGALTAADLPQGTLASRAKKVTGSVSGYSEVKHLVTVFGESETARALAHAGGQDGCDIWSSKWVELALTVASAAQKAAILARCDYNDCVIDIADMVLATPDDGLLDAMAAHEGETADLGEVAMAYVRCRAGVGSTADVDVLLTNWQRDVAKKAGPALAQIEGAEHSVARALTESRYWSCPWEAVVAIPTPVVLKALCARIETMGRGDSNAGDRVLDGIPALPPEAAETLLASAVGKCAQRQVWTTLLARTANPAVAETLVGTLADTSKANVQAAVEGLESLGEGARPALEAGSKARKKAVREACAEVLAALTATPSDGVGARVDALLAEHGEETDAMEVGALVRTTQKGQTPDAERRRLLLKKLGDAFWVRAWRFLSEYSYGRVARWLALAPEGDIALWLGAGYAVAWGADEDDARKLLVGADVTRVRELFHDEDSRNSGVLACWLAANDPDANEVFVPMLGGRTAWVRERGLAGIRAMDDRSALLPLLQASKAALRELAARLLAEHPCEGADKAVLARLKKEKSDKVRATLVNALAAIEDVGQPQPAELDTKGLDARLARAGARLKGDHAGPPLAWTDRAMSADAQRRVLQLLEETNNDNDPLDGIRPRLAGTVELLAWLRSEHADSKEARLGWVLFADALAADEDMLDYGRSLDDLARGGSFKTAEYMLTVLVRQGSNPALQWVDHWARKARSQGLKERALALLDAKATALGVTRDALAETLVPSMGFGADRTQSWAHGGRTFTVRLAHHNTLQVLDGTKTLKGLPGARKDDDAAVIKASKKRLSALKKQLKQTTTAQLERMEDAMVTGRCWTRAEWKRLYVDNPVLSSLARTALWSDGSVVFRVAEDGTAATVDEDEHTPGDAIHLVHPLDLPDRAEWGTVFGDYELIVPYAFFERETYTPQPEETAHVARLRGRKLTAGQLRWGLEKRRWRRGDPQDAGAVCWFTKDFGELTAVVDFSDGFGIGYMDEADPQRLDKVHFIQGNYSYRNQSVPIADVPAVAFSEVVRDLESLG